MPGVRRLDDLAARGHDLSSDQVVARQAVLVHQPSDPTPDGEPGDARCRDDAAGARKAMPRGGCVVVRPAAPAARTIRASGSTWTARIGERSMTIPSSHVEKPGRL